MSLLNQLPETVFKTKVADLLNRGRASSQWYMLFGLACCAIELMQTGGPPGRDRSIRGCPARHASPVGPDDRSRDVNL